jgi:uncharacterized membrane protein YuzA (DUF378 family)
MTRGPAATVGRREPGFAPTVKEFAMALNTTSSTAAAVATRAITPLDWIALVLAIIGGLNWGLVGAFNFDLVAAIFGAGSVVSRLIYILVGLAALYLIYYAIRVSADSRP